MNKAAIIVEHSQVHSLIEFFKGRNIKEFSFERVYTEEKDGVRFIFLRIHLRRVIDFLYPRIENLIRT